MTTTVTTEDRDPSKYTLWWVSNNSQASMYMGDYDSEEEAEAAISGAVRVFIQYGGEHPELIGSWSIEKPEAEDWGVSGFGQGVQWE